MGSGSGFNLDFSEPGGLAVGQQSRERDLYHFIGGVFTRVGDEGRRHVTVVEVYEVAAELDGVVDTA